MKEVSIISIGNEIVKGRTVNTNASEIAMAFTETGFYVSRHVSIPDDCKTISEALTASLKEFHITVTTGGLGPTFDDMTIKCLARGLGKKLTLNEEALNIIEEKYKGLKLPLTEERRKMALFPEDAKIIKNSVGTAPGLFYTLDSHKIFCLPGVPKEMRSMLPEVLNLSGKSGLNYVSMEFNISGVMESSMAPFVKLLMREYENSIFIKTHPVSDEINDPKLTVELYSLSDKIDETKVKMADIKIKIENWVDNQRNSKALPGTGK